MVHNLFAFTDFMHICCDITMKYSEALLFAYPKIAIELKAAFLALDLGPFLADGTIHRALMSTICMGYQFLSFVYLLFFLDFKFA